MASALKNEKIEAVRKPSWETCKLEVMRGDLRTDDRRERQSHAKRVLEQPGNVPLHMADVGAENYDQEFHRQLPQRSRTSKTRSTRCGQP